MAGEGSKSNLGAGTLSGRPDWVLGLDAVGRYGIPVFGNSARIVQTTAPEQDSPMREVPVRITSPNSPNFIWLLKLP